MATEALHKSIEEILDSDVYCAICREVYVNPFILNCSHSFCKYCLIIWLNKQVCCPTCRMVAVFQTENLALRNTISKMISNTSAKFKRDRNNLVKVRMESEAKAQKEGLVPIMEKQEAEMEEDLGYRVRNGRRRRRVIGQWKGPNGATIWRTDMVGDRVIRHHPNESSAESADDADGEEDARGHNQQDSDDWEDEEEEEEEEEVGADVEEFESDSDGEYRLSIFQLYRDGDLPGTDSDSEDSEYIARVQTTSDEEEDDRMCDIDEESCDDDLSGDESSDSSTEEEEEEASSSSDSPTEMETEGSDDSSDDPDWMLRDSSEESDNDEIDDITFDDYSSYIREPNDDELYDGFSD